MDLHRDFCLSVEQIGVWQHPVVPPGGSSAVTTAQCCCRHWVDQGQTAKESADCFMQLSLECYVTVNIKERSFALGCTVEGPVQLWPRGCCRHGAARVGSMLGAGAQGT